MIWLLAGVLGASLLGSLHCAGMCGAFLAIAVTGNARSLQVQAAYHGGRLVTYLGLGAAAGAMGGLADMAGQVAGAGRIASVVSAGLILIFGLSALGRLLGFRTAAPAGGGVMRPLVQPVLKLAMNVPGTARALAIGLVTTLLPCGWLYAFAAVAAGTASPWKGAATMTVFWIGTLPLLVATGELIRRTGHRASSRLGRWIPVASVVALVLLSGGTLLDRAGLSVSRLINAAANQQPHGAEAASLVPPSTRPACCQGGGQ